MENGTYGAGNTDFSKYRMEKFAAHIFDIGKYERAGCGATALSLITGVNPNKIKRRPNYSDRIMLDFLRSHGFRAFRATKSNLTNQKLETFNYKIRNENLVLYSQLMLRNEASWFVTWNGLTFHNFRVSQASFYDVMNFPILSAYVIYNKTLI
jgi:hypothetical protein